MFETLAGREGWDRSKWAQLLGPLLTGEAQRAYFAFPREFSDDYDALKREILGWLGLSPISEAQLFHSWEYQPRRPARAQASELARLTQHWLLDGNPTAGRVVGMRNPTTLTELVKSIELAEAAHHREAGERVPSCPRRVVQERRPPESTSRPVPRPAAPGPADEPMPTEDATPPPRAWLAGCVLHHELPQGAPRVEVKINGRPALALLNSGTSVSLVKAAIMPPRKDSKSRLPITCMHGDTQQVPARHVTLTAGPGEWQLEVRILKELAAPVLLGRDCPGFEQLLAAATQPAGPAGSRRKRRTGRRTFRPALLASDSGRDGESPSQNSNLFFDVIQQVRGGGSFTRAQHEDECLKHCWAQVRTVEGHEHHPAPHPLPHFIVRNGLLYCVAQWRGKVKELLVVPKTKTETLIEFAHAHPMAGHLGATNIIQRIRDRFHWPGPDAEVKRFCQACATCQRMSPKLPPPSPLIPLPIIEVPFERIGMDLVGPLPKSACGHEHVLVIVDYATQYPEAIPLRKAMAKNIAKELFLLCTRGGIPAEILTDQGTPFMSRLMADLCRWLQVKQLRTTVYHPQTDGLDLMLPYVLFGIREVPQASTGFTPFELLFGRQPRGLLDIAREAWEQQQPTPLRSVVEHVREMRERIEKVMPLVREHMVKAQQSQQRLYNRVAQPREFQPGDKVMALVPTAACKFLATWQGPYTMIERVGPVNYRLRQPGRRQEEQLDHVNLLKRWVGTQEQLSALAHTDPVVVDVREHLSAAQKTGRTNVTEHDIRTPPGVIVRQRPYRIPEARRQAIEDEIGEMLKLGVIEPSRRAWSSPIVMVPKPDGTLRFCNDFRCLNQVSEFDGYPMPRVDELLECLGRARGHWQYWTLHFGLHGALATFQRMMDILLRPHLAYAAAYLDDVVIHSETWTDHLERLWRVLMELRRPGLTANPRKCNLALAEAQYLGFQVGRGLIRPQQKKVEAILSAPRPTTKTQVRAFLGLAGYYRFFIPNFSTLASPLTDLTRKGQPEKVIWNTTLDKALRDIKTALTTEPVLRAPDFNCPFLLQTDASDTGLGAVLSQVRGGEEHPMMYIS
ncbi:Retrovirus-related Pol polyprotein from transposon 17.6 [Labeo rohita]|uniref:Gypsy retrotransposon integrase-like protein 1 n=1 Tax=Labeo rohita TaxID=84645 RepID=A0ABQ8L0Y6_LABRO|nr:Retrovirus-related Pol polyprotein from transposon 17.6 [Labeo rohita]